MCEVTFGEYLYTMDYYVLVLVTPLLKFFYFVSSLECLIFYLFVLSYIVANVCVCAGDCLDSTVLKGSRYTPGPPEKLQVSLGWRTEGGRHGEKAGLTPVVNASWRIRDDGKRGRGLRWMGG